MKKINVAIFLIMLAGMVAAQQNIDSLERTLRLAKHDTTRVSTLSALSIAYLQLDIDSAVNYAAEGLTLARKIKFRQGEADCLRRLGIVHYIQGRYPEALDNFQKALAISESIGHSFGIGAGLGHIGNIYSDQGDYLTARLYYFKYLKVAQAMQYNQEQANALSRIGESYLQQNMLDSSSIAFYRAYDLINDQKNLTISAAIIRNLGRLHAKQGETQKALDYFRRGISYAISVGSHNVQSDIYKGIADLYRRAGQTDSCIYYARQALAAGERNNYSKGILAASQLLSEIYEPINEHEAFKYHKMATVVKDSLFNTAKTSQVQNLFFLDHQRQQALEVANTKYKNQFKLYALLSVLFVCLLVATILYRNNRAKQRANEILSGQKQEIQHQRTHAEKALQELKATQAQLIQSEKMASLGELTAGIAHEIQNPLNFVNNFSEVNRELLAEMREEILRKNYEEVNALAKDVQDNEEKINHHGKRADAIVKGMLQHSHSNVGLKEPTDINKLADEYLRLAFHGLRAKDKSFNATMKTDFDETIGNINIIPQDIGRVILNLINNAFYAVDEKKKQQAGEYEPTVSLVTRRTGKNVEIEITDNGNGIPQKIIDKIFQPFFTTKPTGQGTGLGLSLSYDIVKAHGGEIKVETNAGEGSKFIIQLPNR